MHVCSAPFVPSLSVNKMTGGNVFLIMDPHLIIYPLTYNMIGLSQFIAVMLRQCKHGSTALFLRY